MPKIRFSKLAEEVQNHLLRRIDERGVKSSDLVRLRQWVESQPEAPDGDWYKYFGSFKLCGTGEFPKTVLSKGMKAFGDEIE